MTQTNAKRSTSPNKTARRAMALEMLAGGEEVNAVVAAMGVSLKTVTRWQSEMRGEIEASAKARTDGIVEGALEAKKLLTAMTPKAARIIERILDQDESLAVDGVLDAAMLRVLVQAAQVAFDRGGVPAKSEQDLTVGLSTEKRAALIAILGGLE